jgi:3-phenylpropionate/trans-cinnamate dioxygenase ferredoxin reductase subunit
LTDEKHILIVGAGQAGLQAAETLRNNNFQGKISLYGEESYAPYHRPPLSKAWLTAELDENQLTIRNLPALERKRILLRTDCAITDICPHSHIAMLHDGTQVKWDGMILTTGARPRTLPGIKPSHAIRLLRTRRDATEIAQGLQLCRKERLPVVIIGGGFIGLEVAASARKLGLDVTIIEAAKRLLGRIFSQDLSDWFAGLHRCHGVDLVLNASVTGIETSGVHHTTVSLADGRTFHGGLVLVGIGAIPNDELAQKAGIECDNGIVVDLYGRTSARDIVAAGDCTVRRLPDGSKIRLESVHNAIEQGHSAALTLLGIDKPCSETPWFWSNQYDVKLQIAGISRQADAWIIRGDMSHTAFSIFHFRKGRVIAVDSVNSVKDHMLARQLINSDKHPTIDQAANPSFDLSTLSAEISCPLSA